MNKRDISIPVCMTIALLTLVLIPSCLDQGGLDAATDITLPPDKALRIPTFIENMGQIANENVRYYISLGNMSIGFGESEILLNLARNHVPPPLDRPAVETPSGGMASSAVGILVHLEFAGANGVLPKGSGKLSHRNNFLLGNDPSKWHESAHAYREILYTDLYDGIDLIYHATDSGMKYELLIDQQADPSRIVFTYEGVDGISQDAMGNIVIHTAVGDIIDAAPLANQGGDSIRCSFVLRSALSVGFDCDGYNPIGTAVIDPLIYATYLGGDPGNLGSMQGRAIEVDASGDVYVAGLTESVFFPTTPGAYDVSFNGDGDVFVAKLDAAGGALLFSTFLGGVGFDLVWSIFVDDIGNTYIAGETNSTDFPVTLGAYDTSYNGGIGDAFITKLNASGSGLIYSTYLGGLAKDDADSITVDSSGNTYVAGATISTDFPTTSGALNTSYSPTDPEQAFVTRLNPAGTALIYSTFLGGASGMEWVKSIAIDPSQNAYVTGATSSTDFPISLGAFQVSFGGVEDAFVTKLSPAGNVSIYSTFLGGSGPDVGLSIALNSLNEAYVSGRTESVNFPITARAFDASYGGMRDVFVTKLDKDGRATIYSTYLGGSADDYGYSIGLDSSGSAYISGRTQSSNFPTSLGAFDTSYNSGGSDAFLSRLDPSGRRLLYSTFIGGAAFDYALSAALDSSSYAYMTGGTSSADFPTTPGAFNPSYNGGSENAFVAKLYPAAPDLAIDSSDVILSPSGPVEAGALVTINVTIHNIGGINASSVFVRLYDGPPSAFNQIGADRNVPFIQHNGGIGNVSATWAALQAGAHDICAFADPDDVISEENETNNIACRQIEVIFSLQLTPGHRLMSFPNTVADDTIQNVLSSIAGCYDYVRWYDPMDMVDHWKSYAQSRAFNDLAHLDNTMAFWINVTAACGFTPVGTKPVSTTIGLRQGWNMIGFPSFKTTYTVADLRADIGVAGVIVEAFDANAAPYYLQRVQDSYVMMAGEGYWVYVPSDATWTIGG